MALILLHCQNSALLGNDSRVIVDKFLRKKASLRLHSIMYL